MIIKDGRFGAYVTDGEVNATLRRGDEVETITAERGAELLAEKRAKGPAPKKRPAKKAAAKKAPAKKTTAKRPPPRRLRPRRLPPATATAPSRRESPRPPHPELAQRTQEGDHPLEDQPGGLLVVVGQAAVDEQVLLARIEEQLAASRRSTRRVRARPPDRLLRRRTGRASLPCICSGTPSATAPPNSA